MLVKPDERRPLAVLLRFLERGERLAHDCAYAQAALAPDARMGTFLRGQAKQEAFHARLFQSVADWMGPAHSLSRDMVAPLHEFQVLLHQALDRKDFLETILAEQIILESLGEAILEKLEAGIKKRQGPFTRLRRLLIQQEAAHHGFGERVLDQAIENGRIAPTTLRESAQPYLALSQSFMLGFQSQLEDLDEKPQDYIQAHHARLPHWLTGDPIRSPFKASNSPREQHPSCEDGRSSPHDWGNIQSGHWSSQPAIGTP